MRHLRFMSVWLALCFGVATTSAAQGTSHTAWEVEALGGLSEPSQPTGGTNALPAAGPSFTTVTSFPSRQIASWMFGDGNALAGQVAQYVLAHFGTAFPAFPSLDHALTTSQTTARGSFTFGGRVTRRLTDRLAVEGTVQMNVRGPALASGVTDAAEATRAGYVAYFNAFLGPGSGAPFVPTVTATKDVRPGSVHQLQATAALVLNVVNAPHDAIYVLGGAGVIAQTGTAPSVSITGRTTFTNLLLSSNTAPGPIDDTDTVTIQFKNARMPVMVVGGGFKRDVSPHVGVRVDVRDLIGGNKTATILTATPVVVVGAPQGYVATFSSPSVQYSDSSIVRDTLSLDPVSRFQTFTGTGHVNIVSLTAGVFFRF